MDSPLTLRPAAAADCARVLAWANDPVTRAMSFSSAPIAASEHAEWFAAKLADPRCLFRIAERADGEPVGQVRLDVEEEGVALVSVSIDPEHRGRGLGTAVLRLALEDAAQAGIRTVHAYVKPENTASLRAFASAGFSAPEEVEHRGAAALRMSLALA